MNAAGKIRTKFDNIYRYLTAHKRTIPDFLVIGSKKSGTNTLHHLLVQHPQLYFPKSKALNYFDLHFHRSDRYYQQHFLTESELEKMRNEHTTFLQGESSSHYLVHPWAAERAKIYNPHFKIIVVVRDPVKRAISHYKHNLNRGKEKLSFGEAIKTEAERVNEDKNRLKENPSFQATRFMDYAYLEMGLFKDHLAVWKNHFEEKNILLVHFEEFNKDIGHGLNQIYSFLGVNPFPMFELKLPEKRKSKLPNLHIEDEDLNYLINYYQKNHS